MIVFVVAVAALVAVIAMWHVVPLTSGVAVPLPRVEVRADGLVVRVRHAVTSRAVQTFVAQARIARDTGNMALDEAARVETAAAEWFVRRADALAASNPWEALDALLQADMYASDDLRRQIQVRRTEIVARGA